MLLGGASLYPSEQGYSIHAAIGAHCGGYDKTDVVWLSHSVYLFLVPLWWLMLSWALCVCEVAQSCLTLCNPVDCSLPGSSLHGILQARILEWVSISFSRVSSRLRDRAHVSCTAGKHLTSEPPGKPLTWDEKDIYTLCQIPCIKLHVSNSVILISGLPIFLLPGPRPFS